MPLTRPMPVVAGLSIRNPLTKELWNFCALEENVPHKLRLISEDPKRFTWYEATGAKWRKLSEWAPYLKDILEEYPWHCVGVECPSEMFDYCIGAMAAKMADKLEE